MTKMLRWCNTKLEWLEYSGTECTPTPQDRYHEAKEEVLDLWKDRWITNHEARTILLTLFRARYLTSHRTTVNPPIALGSRRYQGYGIRYAP